MIYYVVIIVAAGTLAPLGAQLSSGTLMTTKFGMSFKFSPSPSAGIVITKFT